MKIGNLIAMGASLALLSISSLQAQTADECITEYEGLKAEFELASPGAQVNCVKDGNIISLDAEGPLPDGCEGVWDHWHLEAKAFGGNEAACSMMLRGLDNSPGCGTEELRIGLPANEEVIWRKYLQNECAN